MNCQIVYIIGLGLLLALVLKQTIFEGFRESPPFNYGARSTFAIEMEPDGGHCRSNVGTLEQVLWQESRPVQAWVIPQERYCPDPVKQIYPSAAVLRVESGDPNRPPETQPVIQVPQDPVPVSSF